MALLDDLSGFEFEDLMEDVFRKLGYENVRQSVRTGDEGRDILMEEVVDGRRRGVVVECKHTGTVSRPVVQKLHSAVTTYDYDGPKRGLLVTTGRFTTPAEEYANKVRRNGTGNHIELIDGRDLRDIGDRIGLDLQNGRIEVLCDETLRPVDPTSGFDAPVREAFRDVENIDPASIDVPRGDVQFRAVLSIRAHTDAVFETGVGVIHRIDEQTQFAVLADSGAPETLDSSLAALVNDNLERRIEFDEDEFRSQFDSVGVTRYGRTETEYKEWAVDRLRQYHTTTVTYTGGNNVTYDKECEPNLSDISVQHITPVYLPQITQRTRLGSYEYPYSYCAAGPSRVGIEDGIHRCVHCETSGEGETYTYCANCGSVNCSNHIRRERLEGTPVCTGCAVTESFAYKRKYFYTDENLEEFREVYAGMPLYRKPFENPALVAGVACVTLLLVLSAFAFVL
jgi:restriction endonuclease Mrr